MDKYNYIWIMGGADNDTITTDLHGGSQINFNSDPVTFEQNPKPIEIPFQNISFSTRNGDLIFYSNGCSVYNYLDRIIENGDTLNPGIPYEDHCPVEGYIGTQNMIAIPNPYNDSIVYILHIDIGFNENLQAPNILQANNLYYSTINIKQNNGEGEITEKNNVILFDTNMMSSPLTAVRHANGFDWWILIPDRWTNSFNKILLNQNGPNFLGKQFIGLTPHHFADGGQGKFSPAGNLFAWYHPRNGLFLYDFDRVSGELSNFQRIQIDTAFGIIGGCEFSPSGQYLYVSNYTNLYQLDVRDKDIQKSLVHIAVFDGFGDPLPTLFYLMERTPDSRIFINALNSSQYLHVIQKPNEKGLVCNFEQHAIQLPTINHFTLPHFPNYRLGAVGEPFCDSTIVSTQQDFVKNEIGYVYPNPASDYLYVDFKGENQIDQFTLKLFSSSGLLINVSNESPVDISNLPPGLYFCVITSEDHQTWQSKVVISR